MTGFQFLVLKVKMGTCLGLNKYEHINSANDPDQYIFGPEILEIVPFQFHTHDSLWQQDMDQFVDNIIASESTVIRDKYLLSVIFSFIKHDIYKSIGYPKQCKQR